MKTALLTRSGPLVPLPRILALLAIALALVMGAGQAQAQRAVGIDVYSGDGFITCSNVPSGGYTWAWAKATEGAGYTDSQFANNMTNAVNAGVLIGAYHFARYDLGNSAQSEANWFWSVISPYTKNNGVQIMPMLDVEVSNNLSQAAVSTWVLAWCQCLITNAAASDVTLQPIIYTYPSYADTYLTTNVSSVYQLAMADLNGENIQTGSPYLSTWANWTSWQWSWTQIVPGVPGVGGDCDADVFNGSLTHVKAFLTIGGHLPADSYCGNDGNGDAQLFLPDAVNLPETDAQECPNCSWTGWSSFGGPLTYGAPATVGYNADQRMQVFIRAADNSMWSIWKTAVDGGWSSWANEGGSLLGNVAVGYVQDGSMQIYARSSSNTVATIWQNGPNGTWTNWSDMGGNCHADPTCGANEDGRMQLFTRSSTNTLQSNFQLGGGAWFGWSDYGGSCYGKPAVANLPDGSMEVFVRSSSNTVKTITQTAPNAGWGSWSDLGGDCQGDPLVGYNTDKRLQLFIPTSTGAISTAYKTTAARNSAWSAWTSLGGSYNSDLTVGYNQDGRIEIFMRDTNYVVQSTWETAISASTSWSGWFSMNGNTPTVAITTQPASQNVAVGQNVTFSVTATGALTYQWKYNGSTITGGTNTTLTINNIQTGNAGTYTVVVANNASSLTSSNATLTVSVPPSITTQPANQTVIQGQNATFSVVASGTAPLGYQWQFNGANISGATASSYTVSNAQPANVGSYAVVVTNLVGSVTSSSATLTVNVPPSITTQPSNATVNPGATVTFNVTASGTAPLSYQWKFNGANIAGATASSYSLTNAQSANDGNYSVVITNIAGTVTSANAVLSVNVPPSITTQPVNSFVDQNGSVTFTVVAAGTAPLSYQWKCNSTNIVGATSSTCMVTNALSSNAGTYSVTVTNIAGSVTSANASLTVYPHVNVLAQQNLDGRQELFIIGTNGALYHSYQVSTNGTNWTGWTSLGGTWSGSAQPGIGRNTSGCLEVFIVASNGILNYAKQNSANTTNSWSSWTNLSGISLAQTAKVAVGTNANGTLDVFTVSTNSQLYHNFQTNSTWSGWTSLGGTWSQTGDIGIGNDADGREEAQLIGTNGIYYDTFQTAPSGAWFGSWVSFGGTFSQSCRIAVARDTNGCLETFVVQAASPGTFAALYRNAQTNANGSWLGWTNMSGSWEWDVQPVAKADQNGHLEVMLIGQTLNVYHNYQNPGWSGWVDLNGSYYESTRPALGRNANGALQFYVVGPNGDLQTSYETAPNSTTWSGWTSLGGTWH